MSPLPSARERLVAAAFDLFEERGFDGTTVDDIAERADVGRTTFFRNFKSKEDVIFPAHDALLARIEERLIAAAPENRDVAVAEAARLVLLHYLREGDMARARYRLTTTVPALRTREFAGIRQYQRLFARYLTVWWGTDPDGELRAELLAAEVVTAHNHVLRRWLRRETTTPVPEFDHAMTVVLAGRSRSRDDTAIVVITSKDGIESVADRVRTALAQD